MNEVVDVEAIATYLRSRTGDDVSADVGFLVGLARTWHGIAESAEPTTDDPSVRDVSRSELLLRQLKAQLGDDYRRLLGGNFLFEPSEWEMTPEGFTIFCREDQDLARWAFMPAELGVQQSAVLITCDDSEAQVVRWAFEVNDIFLHFVDKVLYYALGRPTTAIAGCRLPTGCLQDTNVGWQTLGLPRTTHRYDWEDVRQGQWLRIDETVVTVSSDREESAWILGRSQREVEAVAARIESSSPV